MKWATILAAVFAVLAVAGAVTSISVSRSHYRSATEPFYGSLMKVQADLDGGAGEHLFHAHLEAAGGAEAKWEQVVGSKCVELESGKHLKAALIQFRRYAKDRPGYEEARLHAV